MVHRPKFEVLALLFAVGGITAGCASKDCPDGFVYSEGVCLEDVGADDTANSDDTDP